MSKIKAALFGNAIAVNNNAVLAKDAIIQQMLKEFPFGKALILEETPIKLAPLPKGNVSAFMNTPFTEIGFNAAFVYQRFEAEGRKLLDWVRSSPMHFVEFVALKKWVLQYWYDNSTWLNFDKHIANAGILNTKYTSLFVLSVCLSTKN